MRGARKPWLKRYQVKKPLKRWQALIIKRFLDGEISHQGACRIAGVHYKAIRAWKEKYLDNFIEGHDFDEELIRSRHYSYRDDRKELRTNTMSELLNIRSDEVSEYDMRLYSTAEELAEKVEEYFKTCDDGKRPYTFAGLVYHLGFSSKKVVSDYASLDADYARVLSRARLRIETQRSENLVSGAGTKSGQIFDLKNNFGWREESYQQVKKEGGPDQLTVNQNTQNNLMVGTPEKPKSLDEWRKWYAESMAVDKSNEIKELEAAEKAEGKND